MTALSTEKTPKPEDCIDALPASAVCASMVAAQINAVQAVNGALPELEAAAGLIAQTLTQGGRLVYVAAGSSGLMALADGAELPGTFGVDPAQIMILMAGGIPADGKMPGDTEDKADTAPQVVSSLSPNDCIIALSASGSTIFPCTYARLAKVAGIPVISITNNADSDLGGLATVSITLLTPPEVLAGSTRLGASTAQKVALNICSTLAGVMMGHVHNGMMVNLIADNIKLKKRAQRIVKEIASVSDTQAQDALRATNGQTKQAVLVAKGATPETADDLLKKHQGFLGPCMAALA